MRKRWKKIRRRLELFGCKLLVQIVPRMSRRSCVALAQTLGALVFRFDFRGRAVALENLEVVFGNSMPPEEKRRIALGSYQNFARTMLDLFWIQNIDAERFDRWTHVTGFQEIIDRSKREGKGIVFVLGHQGDWEWAALTFARFGGSANIVAQDFKNPALTPVFAQMRSHGKHTLISRERAMLRLLKCLNRGENTALLVDLTIPPSQSPAVLRAFGPDPLLISATQAHVVLAQRGNALLVPTITEPMSDGTVRAVAYPPMEITAGTPANEIAQEVWNMIEETIRRRPDLWIWSYKHFRYRPPNATRKYPSYANNSPQIEEIVNSYAQKS